MSSRPLTNKLIISLLSECVGNINSEFEMYFPQLSQPNDYYTDSLKRYGILLCRRLMGEDVEGEIAKARITLVQATTVRSYRERSNSEISFDQDFDELCAHMNQENNVDVKTLSVRDFYALFGYIKKKQLQAKGK